MAGLLNCGPSSSVSAMTNVALRSEIFYLSKADANSCDIMTCRPLLRVNEGVEVVLLTASIIISSPTTSTTSTISEFELLDETSMVALTFSIPEDQPSDYVS